MPGLPPVHPMAYEAVAEAAIRGEARDLGVADHAALAAALGF